MAFDDKFRLSSHAVILNYIGEVLLLKAEYGAKSWGLPGGALEPGETIHEALLRKSAVKNWVLMFSSTISAVCISIQPIIHRLLFSAVNCLHLLTSSSATNILNFVIPQFQNSVASNNSAFLTVLIILVLSSVPSFNAIRLSCQIRS